MVALVNAAHADVIVFEFRPNRGWLRLNNDTVWWALRTAWKEEALVFIGLRATWNGAVYTRQAAIVH